MKITTNNAKLDSEVLLHTKTALEYALGNISKVFGDHYSPTIHASNLIHAINAVSTAQDKGK